LAKSIKLLRLKEKQTNKKQQQHQQQKHKNCILN